MNKKYYSIIILGICLLAFVLRVWNTENQYVFTTDEEYQATYANTLIKDFHPIWIGVSAAHTGVYLGPWFTYLTAGILALSGGDPIGTIYFTAILGAICTFLVFLLGKLIYNEKVGIFSALLYTTLPLVVFSDQRYWNPTLLPLLSLLMILSLIKIKDSGWWMIIFSGAYATVFSSHLSLVPVLLVLFIVSIWNRKKIKLAQVITALVIFFVIYSPLIVFDFVHNFSNIKVFTRFDQLQSSQSTQIDPIFHTKSLINTLGRLWYLKPSGDPVDEVLSWCSTISSKALTSDLNNFVNRTNGSIIIGSLTGFILIYTFVTSLKKKDKSQLIVSSTVLLISLTFIFFPGDALEYYLVGLYPLIILVIVSFVFNYFYKKGSLTIPILLLCLSLYSAFLSSSSTSKFSLSEKKKLIKQVIEYINSNDFELQTSGMCHKYEGWRYLFSVYGYKPQKAYTDASLGWLYPGEVTNSKTRYLVVVHETRIPYANTSTIKPLKVITEDGFTAFIYPSR